MWAIVELMGHVRLAGKVTEEERFGAKMGRIDIPMADGSFVTQFFGGSSVYRITATTEEIAREVAKSSRGEPVYAWNLKHLLPSPPAAGEYKVDDAEDGEDEDGFDVDHMPL